MNKPRNFVEGSFHHLLNRGNNRQQIFLCHSDYIEFLKRLRKYKDENCISLLCYCLMPNHFHLFAKQLTSEYSLGSFISVLTNSYTRYFNEKYERRGSLFEGRTKNKLIEKEDYFLWLCHYIHNNLVKAKLVERAENWEYSDIKDYLNLRKGTLTDKNEILERFNNIHEFYNFISNACNYDDESIFP